MLLGFLFNSRSLFVSKRAVFYFWFVKAYYSSFKVCMLSFYSYTKNEFRNFTSFLIDFFKLLIGFILIS